MIKVWKKCGLLHSFDQNFQRKVMLNNIKSLLFKHIQDNQKVETNLNCAKKEIDVENAFENN